MKPIVFVLFTILSGPAQISAQTKSQLAKAYNTSETAILYKKIAVDGLEIFYREAGNPANPTILFLHGLPSSSHMYRHIMTDLSSQFYVIAPDYPGFGLSSSPSVDKFNYTFDNLAVVMEHFVDVLGLKKINLYMQDYGGPVGFRIASKRPEIIHSLIIQNANAYMEGIGEGIQQIGKLQQAGDSITLDKALRHIISYEGIKEQYIEGAENQSRISPDAYNMDNYFMEKQHVQEIQVALLKNYKSNFPKYPEWQQYFRKYQPPTLIVWGRNDPIFIAPGAEAYKNDLKNAELHLLNGGHFVLEEHHETVAGIISQFLGKRKKENFSK
jgi:pimeloyl-ACP methyl ester carboxylesterase